MRIERRLAAAVVAVCRRPDRVDRGCMSCSGAVLLLLTGHPPIHSFHRLFDAAFIAPGAFTETIISATPLVFTGLAAAVAFRMNLFNVGGEGQLYAGAITGATVGLLMAGSPSPLGHRRDDRRRGCGGAFLAAIPGLLRAFFSTNEIITSLMLNYVVALVLEYLIFDSHSYLRDTSGFEANVFPQGKTLPDEATWSSWMIHGLMVPLGFLVALAWPFRLGSVHANPLRVRGAGHRRTPRARAAMPECGRVARSSRSCVSRARSLASEARVRTGDFRHQLDPRGLRQASYGYTGIVVAALARYNPLAVVLVAAPAGRIAKRRLRPSGRRLPERPRRRDAGPDPLLRARWRAVRPVPGAFPARIEPCEITGAGARLVNNSLVVVVLASGVLYGTPLPLRGARRVARRAVRRAQPRRRGDDAVGAVMGFWTVERIPVRRRWCSRPRSEWPRWPGPLWPRFTRFSSSRSARTRSSPASL